MCTLNEKYFFGVCVHKKKLTHKTLKGWLYVSRTDSE